uniref:hypothetical protein n=1 Tax=Prevotella sp. TaxID=59823 RepID=UPI004028A5DD
IIIYIHTEMNALIGLIVLFAVAIIGWAIAEMKYKTFTFTRSEKDVEEEELLENEHRAQEFKEMNIRDIMRNNSTNGYNAVG